MMTDMAALLKSGTLEKVSLVAERATGKKPAPQQIWRWCRKGLRGGKVKLAAAWHGGSWCTTQSAFIEFLKAQTATQYERHGGHAPVGDYDEALRAAGLL